jgi:hypothetical protein
MYFKMLTENDITTYLVSYLESVGYTQVVGLTTLQRGIDVTALNTDGKKVCIEVKGETSSKVGTKRFGLPFTGNQIASHVSVALLKTLVTMNEEDYVDCEFGIAFPLNHEKLIRRIHPSLKALGISVYLVSSQNIVVL